MVPQFEHICQGTKVLVGIDRRMKKTIIVGSYQRTKIKILVDPYQRTKDTVSSRHLPEDGYNDYSRNLAQDEDNELRR